MHVFSIDRAMQCNAVYSLLRPVPDAILQCALCTFAVHPHGLSHWISLWGRTEVQQPSRREGSTAAASFLLTGSFISSFYYTFLVAAQRLNGWHAYIHSTHVLAFSSACVCSYVCLHAWCTVLPDEHFTHQAQMPWCCRRRNSSCSRSRSSRDDGIAHGTNAQAKSSSATVILQYYCGERECMIAEERGIRRERERCMCMNVCKLQAGMDVQEKDLGSDLQASAMTACPSKQALQGWIWNAGLLAAKLHFKGNLSSPYSQVALEGEPN